MVDYSPTQKAMPKEARPRLPSSASRDEHQTPTYNISLAIYYLLVIVKGWKEKRIAKVEKYLHALPILPGLGTGLAGLFLKLYNGAGWICWIAPGLPNHPDRHDPSYGVYRLAFLYAVAWFIICFLAMAMLTIYVSVLNQEKKLDKYLSTSMSKKKRTNSIKIRNQAFLYVGCMYMTWLFGSVFRMMQFAGKKPPPAIIVLFVLFFPLQGFFNMLGEILLASFTKIDFIELTRGHKVASRLRMSNPFKSFRRGNKDELKSSKVASAVTNSTIGNSTTEEAVAERPMTEAAISNVSWCAPEGLLEEAPEEAPREGHTDSPGKFEKDLELVVEGMEKDAIDELVEISRA
ncbi:hypothetical protein THAOC_24732 [Thalassiosira oceanica]|uniref:G-protein coupled receptors family 2 profile 2 domain-containing protein n=1 Tax=Thalassiosira oceanica TaxID=159749 RepID=K0RP20_THAOC|nr:hypothetical protein THAOC_24732 [Thalassiosira oceanica]|eukprot:EJK55528.1 hypothetical protein THAOC_24732 [Thalassiosira oceanica]